MNQADEFDRLLAAAADGDLSDTDQLTLAALLRDDPAAQRAYREYLLLDAHLRWERPTVAAAPAPSPLRWRWSRITPVVAIAEGVLVAICVAVMVGVLSREVAAKPDVVSQLADWNLAIADAADPASRREQFMECSAVLASKVEQGDLQPDERQLANALYQRAVALSNSADPMTTAEQLDGISEELHRWLLTHTDADSRRTQAIERHYLRFIELCLINVRKATKSGPDDELQARIEKVSELIARRAIDRVRREAERSANKVEGPAKKKNK